MVKTGMQKILLLLLPLLVFSAFSQTVPLPELPLSEEAENIFSEAVFLAGFVNQNCENIEDQRIEQSMQSIRDMQYRIEEYSVAFGADNSVVHQFYVRTFNPPALLRLQASSSELHCDNITLSLISE